MVEREVYRIEKVLFESRPGLLITGNLYVPKECAVPVPGVLGLCGHSDNGKAQDVYQSFSQGLARLGYVVFIIDPIGQGERLQYPDAQLKSRIGVGVREHLLAGNQQFLVGEFFGPGARGMAFARSITCSCARRWTRAASGSRATPAAAR